MEHSDRPSHAPGSPHRREHSYDGLIVLLFAAAVFVGGMLSPPSLMDDVDAVQAQIARNMLDSGDWVIARLDGVPYLEKSPLIYWTIAASYRLFGVRDWAARIPVVLAAILLCWLTMRYAAWAFDRRAALYSGLSLATCVGLYLFTRIQIPDVMLTATVGLAFWSFQRATEPGEPRPRLWSTLLAISLAVGLLLKGLIAVVAPVGGIFVYLLITRQLFSLQIWRRLHIFTGAFIALAIAAPWHILATLRMPPYFNFTMHSGPGEYHGFFWFYFINEHVLRFLNLRYPRDYNTVPRPAFWLLHLLWLFPWSAYFPAVAALPYRPVDRADRTRLLALCWTAFLLIFFTFSTTQEYYSMPVYPALALLLGCAIAQDTRWVRIGTRILAVVSALACLATLTILFLVRGLPAPGDISSALQQHPEAYTLSLGHMGDLTLASFAYLRAPLIVAALAFFLGALGAALLPRKQALLAIALMMVIFLQASRMALVVFDPYLSSRPLANALLHSPPGQLILDGPYYGYSSVFFYTNRSALLLNGRANNLEYGSYAPGSPAVFIDDAQFRALWSANSNSSAPVRPAPTVSAAHPESTTPQPAATRYYILSNTDTLPHLFSLLDRSRFHQIAQSGGKFLFSNQP